MYLIPLLLYNYINLDFLQFQKWFDDAMVAGLKEPNAMALSTTGKDGKPWVSHVAFAKISSFYILTHLL